MFVTMFPCSGLLAVNTTILAYAGIIVAAGVVVGLVLYFIATNPQSSRCVYSTQYTVHITHYTLHIHYMPLCIVRGTQLVWVLSF